MATKAAEKLFNINHIQSGKKVFKTCPKFQNLMIINGETNRTIRNLPCSFHLPPIQLPDKLDRAAAKYLRDRVLIRPKDLRIQANGLRNALWSRMLLIEKNMAQHIRHQLEKNVAARTAALISAAAADIEATTATVDGTTDVDVIDEVMATRASALMGVQKRDLDQLVLRQMRDESAGPIRYSSHLADLYLVSRLAPNFAACCRVLYEIRKRCPTFQPVDMFDFGSGVGSAAWAANSVWPLGGIRQHHLVDASTSMLAISDYLLKDGAVRQHITALPGVTHRSYLSASGSSEQRQFQLVTSSHSLMDVTGGYLNRRALLDNLWRKTARFLVIVELGTKAGFRAVLEARDWLVESTKSDEQPARIFAPCPHTLGCPKSESACSFSVRYEDLRLTESTASHKTELFSYVILHRGDITDNPSDDDSLDLKTYPRIVSYKTDGAVHDLCNSDGTVIRYHMRTDERSLKRFMRHCQPGDFMPVVPLAVGDNVDDEKREPGESGECINADGM